MRTTRLIGGLSAGCCLLAALSACGDGRADGASPANAADRMAADAMAPAVDPADAALPAPADVTLGADQNAAQIPLPLGHSLAVTLQGDPHLGYVWDLDLVDTNVLRRDGEVVYTPSQIRPASAGAHDQRSADGTFTARFTAVRPGDTWIKLVYHHPFSAANDHARTFTAHVTVPAPA